MAFEPSRLAAESLAVAYARVVPVRQRALRPSQPSRERAWPRWAGWAGGVA